MMLSRRAFLRGGVVTTVGAAVPVLRARRAAAHHRPEHIRRKDESSPAPSPEPSLSESPSPTLAVGIFDPAIFDPAIFDAGGTA